MKLFILDILSVLGCVGLVVCVGFGLKVAEDFEDALDKLIGHSD